MTTVKISLYNLGDPADGFPKVILDLTTVSQIHYVNHPQYKNGGFDSWYQTVQVHLVDGKIISPVLPAYYDRLITAIKNNGYTLTKTQSVTKKKTKTSRPNATKVKVKKAIDVIWSVS